MCKYYVDGLCSTITICENKGYFKVKVPYHRYGIKYDIFGVCEKYE